MGSEYLPICITSVIFVIIVIFVGYNSRASENGTKHVLAGTSKYIFGATNLIPCKRDLKGKVKPRHAMFAHAVENGPMWDESDLLIINTDFTSFEDNKYYLMKYTEDQYRVAKCIDGSDVLAPVFDGKETLMAHEPIGKVIGVWRIALNKYVWF